MANSPIHTCSIYRHLVFLNHLHVTFSKYVPRSMINAFVAYLYIFLQTTYKETEIIYNISLNRDKETHCYSAQYVNLQQNSCDKTYQVFNQFMDTTHT
jgi:hypothetical protein